ncbi:MAG: glycosyltransferase family 39 protein [Bacteroidia bacterium]|nr:glycosyltransferase family 39 protein [Bacteroidia bacterium]
MKNANRLLFLCVFLSFVVKSIIILFFIHAPAKFEVHAIAHNMISGGEMKYNLNGQDNFNYQFPVYPFLLFCVYKVFGEGNFSALFMNLVFSSATALFAFSVFKWFLLQFDLKLKVISTERIALLSVVALLLHPLLIYYSIYIIHPFSLDLLFVFATLYFMIKYFDKQTKINLFIYALCLGFAVLNRTTLTTLLLPFLLFHSENFAFKKKMKAAAFVLFIVTVPASLWLVRNYTIYKQFSLNSSMGQNLWIGALEETEGSANLSNGKSYYAALSEKELTGIMDLSPPQQSTFFSDKYFQLLRQDPARVVKMFFVKLKNFWWFRTGIGKEYPDNVASYIPLYKIVYGLVFFLSLTGIFFIGKKTFSFVSFPLALSLMQAVFYVETRHRAIVEPLLICLAITACFLLFRKFFPLKEKTNGN